MMTTTTTNSCTCSSSRFLSLRKRNVLHSVILYIIIATINTHCLLFFFGVTMYRMNHIGEVNAIEIVPNKQKQQQQQQRKVSDRLLTTSISASGGGGGPPVTSASAVSNVVNNNNNSNNNNNIQRETQQKDGTTSSSSHNEQEVVQQTQSSFSLQTYMKQIEEGIAKKKLFFGGESTVQQVPIKKDNIAIIHVGPHKTGTTSIQADMGKLKGALLLDHYRLPNDDLTQQRMVTMGGLRHCFCSVCKSLEAYISWTLQCNEEQLQSVVDISQALTIPSQSQSQLDEHNNVIITVETLSFHTTDVVDVKNFLTPLYTKQLVVVYYRRYIDWLHSQWHQLNKLESISNRVTFSNWMKTSQEIQMKFYENHYTYAVMKRWGQHFEHIKIYNIHEALLKNQSMSELFFCDALQHPSVTSISVTGQQQSSTPINHACLALKERYLERGGETKFNNGVKNIFVYEELADHALRMIPHLQNSSTSSSITKWTVPLLSQRIQYQQETIFNKTQYDFIPSSITCLDNERLSTLLELTLLAERELFPMFYESEYGEKKIREQFDIDKVTKLCSIDTKIVLQQDPQWIQFFQTL